MADEQMMGTEADDVQFVRTVSSPSRFSIIWLYEKQKYLGRSYMLKLCSSLDNETDGFVRWSLWKSNVLFRRYFQWSN